MTKSITIPIRSFEKGWFVTWTIVSQCYNTGTVQIKSGNKMVAEAKKTSTDTDVQLIGQGSFENPSKDMEIIISVNGARAEIDERHDVSVVLNKNGETVGMTLSMCVEDDFDEDYNDFFISMGGWKTKG